MMYVGKVKTCFLENFRFFLRACIVSEQILFILISYALSIQNDNEMNWFSFLLPNFSKGMLTTRIETIGKFYRFKQKSVSIVSWSSLVNVWFTIFSKKPTWGGSDRHCFRRVAPVASPALNSSEVIANLELQHYFRYFRNSTLFSVLKAISELQHNFRNVDAVFESRCHFWS